MKRKTLLVLGVAGALGCTAASATTFLCETDPSDVSYKACVEIASVATASSPPPMDLLLVSDPGFVTYSSFESRADDSESLELGIQLEPVVTYFYSFNSALDGISAQQFSGQY